MKKALHSAFALIAASLLLLSFASAETASPVDEAKAALKAHDLAKAGALLQPLAGPEGTDPAVFDLLSRVRLAQKNAAEAVLLAEKATKLDPSKSVYFSQLGVSLAQRMNEVGFLQKAGLSGKLKKAFIKAVELDPNDVSALIGLARFYSLAPEIAGGSSTKANELALRVQRINPFLGEMELGGIAAHDEDFTEALKHFEAAAQITPESAQAQNECGQMLLKLKRKEDARIRFEAALKVYPAFEAAQKGLAEATAPSA